LHICPGKAKCFGNHGQLVGQNHVGGRFAGATGSSWRRTDSQRAYLLLNLRARAECFVTKLQKNRKQAAKGEPDEASGET
jgi:hypothetical protein